MPSEAEGESFRPADSPFISTTESHRALSFLTERLIRTLTCEVSGKHTLEWTPTGQGCPHCEAHWTFEGMAERELAGLIPASHYHDEPNAYGYFERVCSCDDE